MCVSNVLLEHCLIAAGFENAVTVVCHDCDVPLSLDMTGDRVPLTVSLKPCGKVREGGRDSGDGGGLMKETSTATTRIQLLTYSLLASFPGHVGGGKSGLVSSICPMIS